MAKKKNEVTGKISAQSLALDRGTVPPQAIELEEIVLAQMLVDEDCIDMILEEVTSDGIFYDPRNRIIFNAIRHLRAEYKPIDIYTVCDRLRSDGDLETVGGAEVIANLSNRVSTAFHVEGHLRRLKEKFIQRELISAAGTILSESFKEGVNVEELINKSQTLVYDAVQSNIKKDVEKVDSILLKVLDDLEKQQESTGLNGVPSGIRGLDQITLGFQPSDLIILAARPSVGKTALALNMAAYAAIEERIPVAIFSLEMPSKQLVKRLMTTETGIDAKKLKGGAKLEPYEWDIITEKTRGLAEAPLYIDDTPSLPVMEFSSKCKRLVKEKGVKLVVVDYLQLMQGPQELRGMREQEVAAISRTLKSTAKELDVPIIALSQLSRQTMQRAGGNNRPQLNDLRESGSIEQDADMVLFIHRYDYQNASQEGSEGKTSLIIAKHRNGEIGEVALRYKSTQVRFVDDSASFIPSDAPQPSMMNSSLDGGLSDAAADFRTGV